jgi:hypothetical protein
MSFAPAAVGDPGPVTTVISVVPGPHVVTHSTAISSDVLLIATLLVGLVIGIVAGRLSARRPTAHAGAINPISPPAAANRPVPGKDASGVDELALACLRLRDSVTSAALRGEIDQALQGVGFEFLDPTGQLFDPAIHEAVERRPTADERTHNVIAATYRPGCAGRGRMLRSPEVAVFRFDAGR